MSLGSIPVGWYALGSQSGPVWLSVRLGSSMERISRLPMSSSVRTTPADRREKAMLPKQRPAQSRRSLTYSSLCVKMRYLLLVSVTGLRYDSSHTHAQTRPQGSHATTRLRCELATSCVPGTVGHITSFPFRAHATLWSLISVLRPLSLQARALHRQRTRRRLLLIKLSAVVSRGAQPLQSMMGLLEAFGTCTKGMFAPPRCVGDRHLLKSIRSEILAP